MKLTDVCDFQGGSQPPKSQWSDKPKEGYIRMLQIRDFTQDNSKVEYVKITNSTKKCEEKDILIARYGASIGKILTGLSGAYNVAMMKVIIDENIVDRKFIYYFLKSDVFQNYIRNVGQRAAQAGFNKGELSKININLPTLKEQKNVAKELDKVQEMIDIREKQIEQLDELIKSQFVEMFGDININDKLWKEDILRNHLKVIGGYAFKSSEFKNSGIPILRIGNINTGYFRPKDLMFWNEEDKLKNYIIYPNDIVMSLTGTVGKDDYGNVCIMGRDYEKYYLNQRNAKLELKDTLDKIYISYALRVPEIKKRLTGISRGVRQANIANKDIENLYIPIPPIELQNQFADIVKQIDKQKFEIQKNLEEMQNLQESLMNKYF